MMAKHVAQILDTEDEAEIQRVTLANLEPLITHDLKRGLYLNDEGANRPWDMSPEQTLEECTRIWDEVGRRDLFLADAYFVPTPAGLAELEKHSRGESTATDSD
jgi:hypothetical protein